MSQKTTFVPPTVDAAMLLHGAGVCHVVQNEHPVCPQHDPTMVQVQFRSSLPPSSRRTACALLHQKRDVTVLCCWLQRFTLWSHGQAPPDAPGRDASSSAITRRCEEGFDQKSSFAFTVIILLQDFTNAVGDCNIQSIGWRVTNNP